MTESPDDRELLEELAPFLEAARREDPGDTIPPEDLTARILTEEGPRHVPFSDPYPNLPCAFGPYELRRVLGRGGGGTVYAGFDPELEREIAIKILAPQLAAIDAARERFLREARAAAKLHHDHVMPIFTVHQDTALPCLTMPLLEGRTLQQRLDLDGPLEPEEIVRIGCELAAALGPAHELGYIHRDVKPSNVFLEAGSGRCRLMDFGLAKATDSPELTQTGMLAGTPEYIAPEQLKGNAPGPRADLYGLGATLYAMATGDPPFRGPSLSTVLKKVADEEAPRLDEALPGSLRAVIERLLEKDPERRFGTAEEVATALQGGRVQIVADSSAQHSWRLVVGMACLAIGVALAFLVLKGGSKIEDSESLARALGAAKSGSTITISSAGEYRPGPFDFGDRDLTIVGTEPGIILVWTVGAEPSLQSTGSLVFKNLTLREELGAGSNPSPSFLDFAGRSLRFKSCQIEQSGNTRFKRSTGQMIALSGSAKVQIEESRVILFNTSFIGARDPGVAVTIEKTIGFVPRLFTAQQGGRLTARDCSFVTHFGVVSHGSQPVAVTMQRCYFQANYALLWLPGIEDPAGVAQRVGWRGSDNLYSSSWLFMLSTPITPMRRIPNRVPPGYQWNEFSDWVSYWGEAEVNTKQVPRHLVQPPNVVGPITVDSILPEFAMVYAEGIGVDPERTGPSPSR